MKLNHMKEPCGPTDKHNGCPFRRDTEPGEFSYARYDSLRGTIGSDEDMLGVGDPMFACHKSTEGKEVACAGWLAKFGQFHLIVRYAVITGALDAAALYPGEDWPELYDDYDQLVADKAGP
jgi:hypothetical protein